MYLDQALSVLKSNNSYSWVLKGTIALLCNIDSNRRMNTRELHDLLHKHSDQIEQKVTFLVDNAPEKLHQ